MKGGIQRELMKGEMERYEFLRRIEVEEREIGMIREKTKSFRKREVLVELLRSNHRLREMVEKQIEEIHKLFVSQIPETELDKGENYGKSS